MEQPEELDREYAVEEKRNRSGTGGDDPEGLIRVRGPDLVQRAVEGGRLEDLHVFDAGPEDVPQAGRTRDPPRPCG